MCTSNGKGIGSGSIKALEPLRNLAPHRWLGLPSILDPMLNPKDKYNQPKTPTLEPVVERQDYKDPVTREQLASSDESKRRRMIAGVATSTLGVTGPASTTRGVIAVGG